MQYFREAVSSLKKKEYKHREQIEIYLILLHLSNKLIPKRIKYWKSEIRPPNCINCYPECVLEYNGHW